MADEGARMNAGAALDSSSALVRAESDHLEATLHALVKRLSSVPGLRMTVTYRHGTLRRLIGDLPYINDLRLTANPVQRIVVAIGPCTYWLQSGDGSVSCGRESASSERGQAEEELSFPAWATSLFDEIARQNIVNHESLMALRELVERDRMQ